MSPRRISVVTAFDSYGFPRAAAMMPGPLSGMSDRGAYASADRMRPDVDCGHADPPPSVEIYVYELPTLYAAGDGDMVIWARIVGTKMSHRDHFIAEYISIRRGSSVVQLNQQPSGTGSRASRNSGIALSNFHSSCSPIQSHPSLPLYRPRRVARLSRVPWNFGGGPVSIRLRSPGHCA